MQWNLDTEGGWNKCKVLSDECTGDLDKAIEDKGKDVEEVIDIFEEIHNEVQFRSFGMVSIAKKKEEPGTSDEGDQEKAQSLLKKHVKDAEKVIGYKEEELGAVGTIYEVAKRVSAGKKVAMLPMKKGLIVFPIQSKAMTFY